MVQLRTGRQRKPSFGRVIASGPAAIRPARTAALNAGFGDDIPDILGSITDRDDLERLHARHVALPRILQLMGRQISREQVHDLLQSPHLEKDLKKLLD